MTMYNERIYKFFASRCYSSVPHGWSDQSLCRHFDAARFAVPFHKLRKSHYKSLTCDIPPEPVPIMSDNAPRRGSPSPRIQLVGFDDTTLPKSSIYWPYKRRNSKVHPVLRCPHLHRVPVFLSRRVAILLFFYPVQCRLVRYAKYTGQPTGA